VKGKVDLFSGVEKALLSYRVPRLCLLAVLIGAVWKRQLLGRGAINGGFIICEGNLLAFTVERFDSDEFKGCCMRSTQ
jgi:hypothetical protein